MQYSHKDLYIENGVITRPAKIQANSDVRLIYRGLLSVSGATEVYAHVGYGPKWNHAKYYKMEQTTDGYEIDFPLRHQETMHVAFKDAGNNWDNNSGRDYSFEVGN
jgi:hypothetical protein